MTTITYGNILAVFFSASETELIEGAEWYRQAETIARTLAHRYGLADFRIAAGVIAALSPNNRWQRNVSDADALIRIHCAGEEYDTIKVSTYSKNKEKGIAILNGTTPLDALGGQKVRSFYNCIIGSDDICIDGHAYSIWKGRRIATTKTPKITAKLYASIAGDYRKATSVINAVTGLSYKASQIQAITWIAWRSQFTK